MSTCISRHGEYGSHKIGSGEDEFTCQRCFVFDEDAALAQLRDARAEVERQRARADAAERMLAYQLPMAVDLREWFNVGAWVGAPISTDDDPEALLKAHCADCAGALVLDHNALVAEVESLRAKLAAVQEWAMVNEIAAPPLDWAALGRALAAAEQDERCGHEAYRRNLAALNPDLAAAMPQCNCDDPKREQS